MSIALASLVPRMLWTRVKCCPAVPYLTPGVKILPRGPGWPHGFPYAGAFKAAWASRLQLPCHLVSLTLSLSIFAFSRQSLNNEKEALIVLEVVPMAGRS